MHRARRPLRNRFRRLLVERCEDRRLLALDPSLAARWSGDGNANDSTGNYPGILQNGTNFATAKQGQGFSFDGIDDFVEVPNSAALNISSSKASTQMAWVLIRSFRQDVAPVTPVKLFAYGLLYSQDKFFRAHVCDGTRWLFADFRFELEMNRFYHVAQTWDGSLLSVYVNGELIGSSPPVQGVSVAGNLPLTVGKWDARPVRDEVMMLDGIIDEAAVYNLALTAAEVKAIYAPVAAEAVAVSDSYSTTNENTLKIDAPGVLANDTAALRAVLVVQPEHGTLSLRPDGGFSYAPNNGYFGPDSFMYRPSQQSTSIAIVSIDVTSPVAVPLPSGAVAWWQGDGDANDSVGTHNGVLQEDATYGVGKIGQAFDFDGDGDFVQVPDSPAWALATNDFSIALWVNLRTLGSAGLIFQDEGPGSQRKWGLRYTGYTDKDGITHGGLQFHINAPELGSGVWFGSSFPVTIDTWHHFAVTRHLSVYSFYADGILLGSGTENTPIPDVAAPITIGSFEGENFLNGKIDDLTVYNRALAGNEVHSIYTAASAGLFIRANADNGQQSFRGVAQSLFANVPPDGDPGLSFTVKPDKAAIFSSQPVIDSTGTLTLTPAPNSQGLTAVTVVKKNTAMAAFEGEEAPADETAQFTIEIVQKAPWQNDVDPNDVDNKAGANPDDVLMVIEYINGTGTGAITNTSSLGPFYDADGDNYVSPNDVLCIINWINASDVDAEGEAGGEGEGATGREGEGETGGGGLASRRPAPRENTASWQLARRDLGREAELDWLNFVARDVAGVSGDVVTGAGVGQVRRGRG